MKRLTEKDWKDKCEGYPWNVHPIKDIDDLPYYKKLAAYEDAEEQGLLVRLPCKVGDTAWYLSRSGIHEVEIDSFVVNINIFVNVSYYIGCEKFGKTLTPYKTLFFSREEAEAKLKEMSCFQNGNL